MGKRMLVAAVLALGFASTALAETYTIDRAHSGVGFSVRHLAISRVQGSFGDFSGTVTMDPADTSKWACEAIIQVASIDTRDSSRDAHLRSADFFDVANHPTMAFKSSKVTPKGGQKFAIEGSLTLRGVTKPVTLDAEWLGATDNPGGGKRVAFTASTRINRMDYGVSWNRALETGGLVVSHEVDITLDIAAVYK